MVTIVITVLVVFAGTLLTSVRISDLNQTLNCRIDDFRDVLRAEFHRDLVLLDGKTEGRFNLVAMRFDSVDRKLDQILRTLRTH